MIKYHPNQDLLTLHAKGELPLSLSIAVSAHCELCPECAEKVAALTIASSEESFSLAQLSTDNGNMDEVLDTDLEALLADMMSDDTLESAAINLLPAEDTAPTRAVTNIKGQDYTLPWAFRQQINNQWQGIGKVSRLRLETGEAKARASLLHIAENGEIPQHSHKGEELTLLLAGEFSDEYNTYTAGDFMVLNSEHEHSPKTIEGCLCYTVVDAPLYFTKGISKLLNPIGELIY
ncbi:ChrR family anti-sigma-E factor [Shewanella olleyana]|uniref:ChrR family anti-sigma-E factor n=1 Tax=Shewanella olleyana TaxID=135626 RepID=UPI00200FDDD6|nr:ChrR family anti-sigma-E factor [Shewanella olleyana]MCL1067901.1 ChrR family anti-sigma-E factor [Shewanella olleyana]